MTRIDLGRGPGLEPKGLRAKASRADSICPSPLFFVVFVDHKGEICAHLAMCLLGITSCPLRPQALIYNASQLIQRTWKLLSQLLSLFFFFFETGSHYIAQAQAGLEFTIVLPQPPKYWDYRYVSPLSTLSVLKLLQKQGPDPLIVRSMSQNMLWAEGLACDPLSNALRSRSDSESVEGKRRGVCR
jgi:hypothetical protein